MENKRFVGVELSHHNAPIEVREKVALNKDQVLQFLKELKGDDDEVFILSTCNRLAVYAYTAQFNKVTEFFSRFGNLNRYLSIFSDTEIAVKNLFSTAAGLESQAIGEHQILGQIRSSYDIAKESGTVGPYIDELIRTALLTGKRVRHETNIGKFSTSLATVGFEIINKKYEDLSQTSVLVIGTGDMANLVATILERTSVKNVYIASHDIERATLVADEWGGNPVDINNLYNILPKVEVIIGGTQAEVNLLSEEALENSNCPRAQFALQAGSPKLFIDFGMPRNFNPNLKAYENVSLYDLDDIKELTYESMLKRADEIPSAKAIVQEEIDRFLEWKNHRQISPLISALMSQVETIKEEELNWLLPKLGEIDEAKVELIKKFSHRIVRRLSSTPLKHLKDIAQNKHIEQNPINTVQDLFAIKDVNIFIPKKQIIVGTRGSKLALTQTNMVVEALNALEPQYEFVLKIIKTKGDEGKLTEVGAFTKGIQRALLNKEIDIAVHSLKDLPSQEVPGLTIAAIPKRVDPRDALIANSRATLHELAQGAVVGTGSLRRKIQLLRMRPDLDIRFIKGNIDGRMKQMEDGNYDAIILAAAGLKRMGLISKASQLFEDHELTPAVNQGALGIEVRDSQDYVYDLVSRLNDKDTYLETLAERSFLKTVGGGCNEPYAARAYMQEEQLEVKAFYANENGEGYVEGSISGNINEASSLGKQLAEKLMTERAQKVSSSDPIIE